MRVLCKRVRLLRASAADGAVLAPLRNDGGEIVQCAAEVESDEYAVYDLDHESDRPSIAPSRGAWHIVVRYQHVAVLEWELLQAGAARPSIGLQPLSRFAPYRFGPGCSCRADVIAQRTRGLCRFFEHVLRITEAPEAQRLARIVDAFVVKHGALKAGIDGVEGESEGCIQTNTGAENAQCRDSPRKHTWVPWRFVDVEPFVEQVPLAEAANDVCDFCGQHLRRAVAGAHHTHVEGQLKGCLRLRSCGHEVHAECFTAFVRGRPHPREEKLKWHRRPHQHLSCLSRARCPRCQEPWSKWQADPSGLYPSSPSQLAGPSAPPQSPRRWLDTEAVHIVSPPGRAETPCGASARRNHGPFRKAFLARTEWFAENPVEACRPPSGGNPRPPVETLEPSESRRRVFQASDWLPKTPVVPSRFRLKATATAAALRHCPKPARPRGHEVGSALPGDASPVTLQSAGDEDHVFADDKAHQIVDQALRLIHDS